MLEDSGFVVWGFFCKKYFTLCMSCAERVGLALEDFNS